MRPTNFFFVQNYKIFLTVHKYQVIEYLLIKSIRKDNLGLGYKYVNLSAGKNPLFTSALVNFVIATYEYCIILISPFLIVGV